MKLLDQHISQALYDYGIKLEEHFGADVLAYMGAIHPALVPQFIEYIESLNKKDKTNQLNPHRLVIILTTG